MRKHDEKTAIFGLDKCQLEPIVENIACEKVKTFDITNIGHEIKAEFVGVSGDKVMATFRYITESGRKDTKKVFIKRFYEPDPIREAWHYMALQKYGVPIPKFYGSLNISQADECEIIFLECITPVPDYRPYTKFVADESKYIPFIKVTAHLDAIKPSGEYFDMLDVSPPQELFDESIQCCFERFNQLWQDASDAKLGERLREICTDRALNQIQRLPERLMEIDFAPFDYFVHDCYEPCHTGWRENTGEMLIFDLAGSTLGARFSNGGIWLGEPDEVRPKCRPRRELAEIYLGEYIEHGGEPVPLEQFLAESKDQWLCEAIWLLDRWRKDILEGKSEYRELLFRLINFLIKESNIKQHF